MTEIKFRAWHKKQKEMCKVISLCKHYVTVRFGRYDHEMFDDDFNDQMMTEEFEIMQYTGLKDKNGKEIYERDIAEIEFGKKAEIKYIKNGGGFFLEIHHKVSKEQIQLTKSWADDIEVIGNKHENPELLKGE